MAKAQFPCAGCGAFVTVGGTSYNRNRADSYAAYCEKRGDLCEACKQAQFARENARAAVDSADACLAPLTGSEKQVAWANTLRLKLLPMIDAAGITVTGQVAVEEPALSAAALAEVQDAIALLVSEMRARTEATWWIDVRREDPADLLRQQLAKRGQMLAPTAYAEMMAGKR